MLILVAYTAAGDTSRIMVDAWWLVVVVAMIAGGALALRDERWSRALGTAVAIGGLLYLFFSL